MSKRSADGVTPPAKQPRVGDATGVSDATGTPATSVRPHGRVVLDVGGKRFVSIDNQNKVKEELTKWLEFQVKRHKTQKAKLAIYCTPTPRRRRAWHGLGLGLGLGV